MKNENEGPLIDHKVMLAVKNGDLDKLGELFEKHHLHLYRFFYQHTGHQQNSEDLVQEVFLRILKYRHTYRAEGKFTTWMFSIAHNIKVDYYKKRLHNCVPLENQDMIQSGDINPEESTVRDDLAASLQQALWKLPEEKRAVLIMSQFDELKYEDIGYIMGCKIGTVKARVHRALKALGKEYKTLTCGRNS